MPSPRTVLDLLPEALAAADAEVEEINASILRTGALSGAKRQIYDTSARRPKELRETSPPVSSQRQKPRQPDSNETSRLRDRLYAEQRRVEDLKRQVAILQAQVAAKIAESPELLTLQHQHNLLHARHREVLQKHARTQLAFRSIAELASEAIDLRPPPPPPKSMDIDQAISALLDF